jgi:hypothetical protein
LNFINSYFFFVFEFGRVVKVREKQGKGWKVKFFKDRKERYYKLDEGFIKTKICKSNGKYGENISKVVDINEIWKHLEVFF